MAAQARSLELALKIRTDLEQGIEDLKAYESGLTAVGAAGKRAGDGLKGVDGKALGDATRSAKEAGESVKGTGENAEVAANRIRDMVAASLEQKRATDAQIASQVAAVDAERTATHVVGRARRADRACQPGGLCVPGVGAAQMQSIGELSQRIERGARSFEDLAETERLIDQQMRAGLLTESEQLDMLKALDEQEKKLLATQQRETEAVQALLRAYDPATSALRKLDPGRGKTQGSRRCGPHQS